MAMVGTLVSVPSERSLAQFAQRQANRCPKSSSAVLSQVLGADTEDKAARDILQFSTSAYFCSESEAFIEVQVDRLGRGKGVSTVEYSTLDGSAQAGVKYVAQQGTLVFDADVTEQRLRIQILQDERFDTELEFEILLANPQNAVLDLYLHKCQITVVDDDAFPTNRFREQIRSGESDKIAPHILMLEFWKMNWRARTIRCAFIKTALSDQIVNLKHIMQIVISAYMIDEVLKPDDGPPANAYLHVVLLSFLGYLAPHPVQWVFAQLEANRRVAGKAIAPLQASLMRKFLHYNDSSHKVVSSADFIMSVTRDIPDLVLNGFTIIFPIMQKIGLLLMLGVMAVQRSTGLHRLLNITFFCCYPIFMFAFLGIRERGTVVRRHKIFSAQTDLCSFVTKVTDYIALIAAYYQQLTTVNKFSQKVKACNAAATEFLKWGNTNRQFAPLLTDAICVAYTLSTAQDVIDGGPVGRFIAGLSIFRGIGQCYQGIYEHMLTMQQAMAPLQNIVFYMNLPIDLSDRMMAKRELLDKLDEAQAASQGLLYENKPHNCSLVQNTTLIRSGDIVEKAVYAQDLVQIDCQDLSFSYSFSCIEPRHIFSHTSFEVAQGQLVAVMGPRGSGKATLLKLCAGVILPSPGSGLFFVPPHLKVGHVTLEPAIIHDESILENLRFGPSDEDDEDGPRIIALLQRLNVSQDVLQAVEYSLNPDDAKSRTEADNQMVQTNNIQMGSSQSIALREKQQRQALIDLRMSYTDRCLVHIARGLVMNPDVLILHKPLSHFGHVQGLRIMELLREFVDMRGVEKPLQERVLRRPRTCIYSALALEGIDFADMVLQVDAGTVQQVNMTEFREVEATAHAIFAYDSNRDGRLTFEEFCQVFLQEKTEVRTAQLLGINLCDLAGKTAEGRQKIMEHLFDAISTGTEEVTFEQLMAYMRHHMHKSMPTHDNLVVKPGKPEKPVFGDNSNGAVPMWEIPEISMEGQLGRRCRVSAGTARNTCT